MINILKDIEPYYDFIEEINKTDEFCDTVRSTLEEYATSVKKDDNITFLVKRDGILKGIFSFLILPDEKYAESLFMMSIDKEAYEEALSYLYQNYKGYECYFVYNPKNEILNSILKREKGEFFSPQKEMEFNGKTEESELHTIIKLTPPYHQEYSMLHNKDLYWTAEKIIENGDFTIFISLEDGKVTGYVDISEDEDNSHIMDILVDDKYRNKGYGRDLLIKAIKESYPKKVTLEVDEDNLPARHLYEKLGFHYLKRKDLITVYLKF